MISLMIEDKHKDKEKRLEVPEGNRVWVGKEVKGHMCLVMHKN